MSLIGDALRRSEEDGPTPAKPSLSLAKPSKTEPQPVPAAVSKDDSPPPTLSPPPEQPAEVVQPKSTPLTLKSHHPKPEPEEAPGPLEEAALAAARRPAKKKHKAWVELLIVLLTLVLLVFAGVALYLYLHREAAETPAAGQVVVRPAPATPSAPAATPPTEPAPEPATAAQPAGPLSATRETLARAEIRVAETDEVGSEFETASEPALETVEPPAAPEVEAVDMGISEKPQPSGMEVAAEVDDQVAAAPPTETLAPPPVIWPGFSLQAAMGSGKNGSVMIDGSIVKVGEAHGELNILEITPGGVLIEYMGERRTFRVRR